MMFSRAPALTAVQRAAGVGLTHALFDAVDGDAVGEVGQLVEHEVLISRLMA